MVLDAGGGDLQVLGGEVDADEAAPLGHRSNPRCARAGEGIEHHGGRSRFG